MLVNIHGFFLQNTKKIEHDIEMYQTYNEGKSVVAERFVKTLKNKIYKYMAVVLKNVCFDVLDDIVNK